MLSLLLLAISYTQYCHNLPAEAIGSNKRCTSICSSTALGESTVARVSGLTSLSEHIRNVHEYA